ncbi:MAG TPA: hypothetical protein VFN08_09750 [Gemmatimonadales bacterium]|jgi:hypothetical protein|nr:hypothetical protein [Gemmatimonadales bacterium]
MAVVLEIRDGNPWYLSPDVWTVPGDDPQGPSGLPVVGQKCFLWARVRNTGGDPVAGATVRFYWANPGVGFDRTSATPVGTSFVTLSGNDEQDVLCLTPWIPSFVNGGHECVLAETYHALDPLPPGPAFNVPTDRHVAQRNLSVVVAAQGTMFHFAFEVHNASRMARTFAIGARAADPKQLEPLIPRLGRRTGIPSGRGEVERLGFVPSACPQGQMLERASPKLERIEVAGRGRTGFSVVGTLKGDAALINVTQEASGAQVGGLAVLVIRA